MKPYTDVPGWFDWQHLYDRWIQGAKAGSMIVEVGAWLGRSACYAGQVIKKAGRSDIRFLTVDHCRGSMGAADEKVHLVEVEKGGGTIAGALHRNLLTCGVADVVSVIVGESERVARLFPEWALDAVFIDASHDFESVTRDLVAWWPKVKREGRMAGHDYTEKWPEVVRAVDLYFKERGRTPERPLPTCWEVKK